MLEPYAATDPGYRVSQALRDVGIVEGRDILVEWRYAEGHIERTPALAADLAGRNLDAIVAIGDVAIRALRAATATTPIVAGTDDLIGEGHAVSLSHPGGNVTGISILASELNSKRLEVLNEAVPSASRVTVLWDPATGTFHLPTLRSVAQTLGIELQVHEVTGSENLIKALDAAQTWGAEAMNVLASPTLHALRRPRRQRDGCLQSISGESPREKAGFCLTVRFALTSIKALPASSRGSSRAPIRRSSRWSNRPGSSWSST